MPQSAEFLRRLRRRHGLGEFAKGGSGRRQSKRLKSNRSAKERKSPVPDPFRYGGRGGRTGSQPGLIVPDNVMAIPTGGPGPTSPYTSTPSPYLD